ncbi:MAG TPA: zf-HC2 domain-containing protein [Candidatus Acidoferrales bacterium]|nr:zf-HC2 domain-containing protein [Candidatus Acidoferrales bacterium]
MNCDGVIRELSNFLDGELDPAVQRELERHLGDCGECALIVDQTKKTVQIFCDSEPVELPAEVRSRLREALRRKMGPSSA